MYIYQNADWPNFTWKNDALVHTLAAVKFEQGRLLGKMGTLGFKLQKNALLETLTIETIKTCEIEGEQLNSEEVRSSIARHLGINIGGLLPSNRHVDGIVEMLLDATQNYEQPLTEKRICHWHAALFPTGMSGLMLVNPGVWRTDHDGPMQVVSGNYGKEKIHFQAPPAEQLPREMQQFLQWFNFVDNSIDPVIKAALAHLWFVTIHPFDDGNGRIARAIADMALARAEQSANRFYSMSRQIRKQRKEYYEILERTQKNHLDVSPWLVWFLQCLHDAILQSESTLENILNKAKFWESHAEQILNRRQIHMLNNCFDGLKGKLSSSKWAKMMNCSQDTAQRDLNDLISKGILIKSADGGRSTSYLLKDFPINFIE